MVHDATHVENNMDWITFRSESNFLHQKKIGKKTLWFRSSDFMVDYISAYKLQMNFLGLNFQDGKPRMNAELRVMMAEL